MKNPVLIWLLLLILICFSGCFGKKPVLPQPTPIVIHSTFTKCDPPVRAVLKKLNEAEHIGSKENLEILINNMLLNKHYITGLESCIRCYEAQIKED